MPLSVPQTSLYRQMGVYLITNSQTGRAYIGSSTNIGRRWSQHKVYLRSGTHTNKRLSADWEAFGPSAFTCRLIETVATPEDLLERETHHVSHLSPFYNGDFAVLRPCKLGPRTTQEKHEARFWQKVQKQDSGCWLWVGSSWDNGFHEREMKFGVQGQKITARRYAYQLVVGPIPEGYRIFKQCNTPQCVNPVHITIQPAHKSTCVRGHARSGANLTKSGACRLCQKIAGDNYRQRKRSVK